MKLPFVSRRRYEDDLLDAQRKINQLDHAARTFRAERDALRVTLVAELRNPVIASSGLQKKMS